MATTPIGRRRLPRRRARARRRRSMGPLLAGVQAGVARADPGGSEDLVDPVGPLVAIRVAGVVFRVEHERGDLLPSRCRALALHEAALDVNEVRRGGYAMRVPG